MKITEHNVETGEIIERNATAEEIAQRELDELAALELKEKEAAAKARREDLLNRLGITEEEAKLLLS
jgi:hypothetical protein